MRTRAERKLLSGKVPDSINIGCGYDKRDGFLNVDMDAACDPDLLIVDNDLSVLPRQHFVNVVANDVLEHIPRSQTMSALLEWADLTAASGTLRISTSSILGVAKIMDGQGCAEQLNWTKCLFGNQAHPGDFHFNGFTEATLRCHLLAAGFRPGEIAVDDGWLFRVSSTKAEDWTELLKADLSDRAFSERVAQVALEREMDEPGLTWCLARLAGGRPRREVLKHYFASEERLYLMAGRVHS